MPKKSNSHFPTRASLIEATFKAITGCGGSATNDEILVLQQHPFGYKYYCKFHKGIHASAISEKMEIYNRKKRHLPIFVQKQYG